MSRLQADVSRMHDALKMLNNMVKGLTIKEEGAQLPRTSALFSRQLLLQPFFRSKYQEVTP
jgi:hypothetical protein